MTGIRLEQLSKTFGRGAGQTRAVADVDLEIRPGELFFLLGPSGCGKTTLLRMIAGLAEPTGGKIFFDDRDVTSVPIEKRNTAMVFQSYALWPHMTVRQNVEFGPRMARAGRQQRRELADENLRRVHMADYAARKPNQLSGGQQQRVALARALAARPACLLLDEPLSNLDAQLRLVMRSELRELVKATGTTGVYVTHDQKEALSMADRVAVMSEGRIVQVGTPEELYSRPATVFVADFLGEANFVRGRVFEAGDPAKIETDLGLIRAACAEGLSQRQAVTCCVRPERIGLQLSRPEGDCGGAFFLPGRVESSMYLGEMRQYRVKLGEQALWRVSTIGRGGKLPEAGQAVWLEIDPADVVVL